MASAVQLKLSLYGLNPVPVSQDEVGNSKRRNLNHQYFCHLMFFLLNSIIFSLKIINLIIKFNLTPKTKPKPKNPKKTLEAI